MKKILAIILAMLMIFSLAACNKPSEKETDATDAHKHSFSEEWEKDSTHHWHVCSDDKCDETDDKAEHVWDNGKVTTEPTKEKDGVTTFTCSICGQTKTEATKYVEKLPATEDEILAYVLAAMDETAKYNGSMSLSAAVNMILAQKEGDKELNQSNISSEFLTFDAENKVMYGEEASESSGKKSVYYTKTFFDNGALYGYEKEVATEENEENSEQYTKFEGSAKEEYQSADFSEYLEEIFEMYKGIKLAENMAEIKAAYETTLPLLLLDIYDDDNAKPTITVNTTATGENGKYDLVFDIRSSATTTEEGIKTDKSVNIYIKASAQDKKLVAFAMKFEIGGKVTQGETVMMDATQKMDVSMDIGYTFAKDKYDALAVNLPTNPDDIEIEGSETVNSYEDLKISIIVNGTESNVAWFMGVTTPAAAFDNILMHSEFYDAPVTIKVFKDEALTQELTKETVTEADIFSLEKVYLSVTPDADHAIVFVTETTRENYSKPYQIVIPTLSMFMGGYSSKYHANSCEEAGEYTLDVDAVSNSDCEIIINGTKMETKTETITLEGGKTYTIEYVTIISDPVIGENK